jgi:hypothetical protein
MMFELQSKQVYQDCIRKPAFKSAFKLEFEHMSDIVDSLRGNVNDSQKQEEEYLRFIENLSSTPNFPTVCHKAFCDSKGKMEGMDNQIHGKQEKHENFCGISR